jgi:preprotein translocase subunit SecD
MGRHRWAAAGLVFACVLIAGCDSSDSQSATTTTLLHKRTSLQVRPVIWVAPPSQGGETIGAGPGYDVVTAAPSLGAPDYGVGAVAMTEKDVRRARARSLPGQGWVVDLSLAPSGVRAMKKLVAELYPNQPPQNSIAIVVDGKVVTAPAFQRNSFSGHEVQISNSHLNRQSAQALAASLSP